MRKFACYYEVREAKRGKEFCRQGVMISASSLASAMTLAAQQFRSWGFEVRDPLCCEYFDAHGERISATNDLLHDMMTGG